jgi:hypothetical protein
MACLQLEVVFAGGGDFAASNSMTFVGGGSASSWSIEGEERDGRMERSILRAEAPGRQYRRAKPCVLADDEKSFGHFERCEPYLGNIETSPRR